MSFDKKLYRLEEGRVENPMNKKRGLLLITGLIRIKIVFESISIFVIFDNFYLNANS